MYLIARIVTR